MALFSDAVLLEDSNETVSYRCREDLIGWVVETLGCHWLENTESQIVPQNSDLCPNKWDVRLLTIR